MITSSNFFNKNLFVGEDDDYKGLLDEDRWLPVSSRKPYATIEMLNHTNSHNNASQKSNTVLPSIQSNQKMQRGLPSHSSKCRFKQRNNQQKHVFKRSDNNKKSIQSTNFEYEDKLPKSNRYFEGYEAGNKEDDDHHNTLGAFLNTKRLKSLQKYTLQSIKSEQKHENKKGRLNIPKGTQIQLIEEIKRGDKSWNERNINFSDLRKNRNYSPLANQLNFILKSRQKYEKSLANRSKAKNNLYKSIQITSKYPSERLNRKKTTAASKMVINKL